MATSTHNYDFIGDDLVLLNKRQIIDIVAIMESFESKSDWRLIDSRKVCAFLQSISEEFVSQIHMEWVATTAIEMTCKIDGQYIKLVDKNGEYKTTYDEVSNFSQEEIF